MKRIIFLIGLLTIINLKAAATPKAVISPCFEFYTEEIKVSPDKGQLNEIGTIIQDKWKADETKLVYGIKDKNGNTYLYFALLDSKLCSITIPKEIWNEIWHKHVCKGNSTSNNINHLYFAVNGQGCHSDVIFINPDYFYYANKQTIKTFEESEYIPPIGWIYKPICKNVITREIKSKDVNKKSKKVEVSFVISYDKLVDPISFVVKKSQNSEALKKRIDKLKDFFGRIKYHPYLLGNTTNSYIQRLVQILNRAVVFFNICLTLLLLIHFFSPQKKYVNSEFPVHIHDID